MSFKPPGPLPVIPQAEVKPPFIAVPNVNNLRDVSAGIQPSGRSIRPRLLYRSGDPSNATLDGVSILHNELGIRTVFDLRSAPEIANNGGAAEWEARLAAFNSAHSGSAAPAPVVRRWAPVFRAEDYGPESVALRFRDYASLDDGEGGFVRAYAGILENGAGSFCEIITHLARGSGGGGGGGGGVGGGTLVHCSAGKDRAGVLVAVVLDLLGVDRESIARDYNLTEVGMAERKPYLIARMVSTGLFGEGESAKKSAERMTGARKESMLATLKYIDEKYGGTESYVKNQCGISQQTIDALRRRFDVRDATTNGNGQAVL